LCFFFCDGVVVGIVCFFDGFIDLKIDKIYAKREKIEDKIL
jgi:hypothetical protein